MTYLQHLCLIAGPLTSTLPQKSFDMAGPCILQIVRITDQILFLSIVIQCLQTFLVMSFSCMAFSKPLSAWLNFSMTDVDGQKANFTIHLDEENSTDLQRHFQFIEDELDIIFTHTGMKYVTEE